MVASPPPPANGRQGRPRGAGQQAHLKLCDASPSPQLILGRRVSPCWPWRCRQVSVRGAAGPGQELGEGSGARGRGGAGRGGRERLGFQVAGSARRGRAGPPPGGQAPPAQRLCAAGPGLPGHLGRGEGGGPESRRPARSPGGQGAAHPGPEAGGQRGRLWMWHLRLPERAEPGVPALRPGPPRPAVPPSPRRRPRVPAPRPGASRAPWGFPGEGLLGRRRAGRVAFWIRGTAR